MSLDYCNFSVKVAGGSGCLIHPVDRDYYYVLTAKHVIKNNTKEDIKVVRLLLNENEGEMDGEGVTEDKFEVLEIYLHPSENCDAAVLKVRHIKDPEVEGKELNTEGLSNLLLLNRQAVLVDKTGYFLTGHPKIRRFKKYSYRQNETKIKNSVGKRHIEAEVENCPDFVAIQGLSGSGIIKKVGDNYFLAGILSQMAARDEDEVSGRVEIMPVSFFEDIVKKYGDEFRKGSETNGDYFAQGCDHLIKDYYEHLRKKVSKISILGESRKYELTDVFVELTVVKERERPSSKTQADYWGLMDSELRERRRLFAFYEDKKDEKDKQDEKQKKIRQTVLPDELLLQNTNAVIVGSPGSGKSTLLRYLVSRTLKQNKNLAVLLEFRTISSDDFKNAKGNLENLIFEKSIVEPLRLNGTDISNMKMLFFDKLKKGNVSLFLDGLDEVSGTEFFKDLLHSITDFCDSSYSHNNLLISTRPYALRNRFISNDVVEMEIKPLNLQQIRQFVKQYFGEDSQAKKFLEDLHNRSEMRELANVPALLGFLINIKYEQTHVAQNKLELYRLLINQLVNEWDEEKGAKRGFLTQNQDRRLDFLRHLAFTALLSERFSEVTGRLILTSDMILSESEQYCHFKKLTINSDDLASDVISTPLLREIGVKTYAFTHLTIQEYLAAEAVVKRTNRENIVCQAYFDPTLCEMEVLPMALGLINDPTTLYYNLAQLPESLSFSNLRLQLRGLSYGANIDTSCLDNLTNRLMEFIKEIPKDKDPYAQNVFRSLSSEINVNVSLIVERITDLLSGDDCSNWDDAILTLGWIGAEQSIPHLLKILIGNEHTHARKYAAISLGRIKSEEAIEDLIITLKDENFRLRQYAAQALGSIGSDRAVKGLLNALQDEEEDVKKAAKKSLVDIGSDYVVEALLSAFIIGSDKTEYIYILREIGSDKAVDALLSILQNSDNDTKSSAASALNTIGSEYAENALLSCLSSDDAYIRETTVSSLRWTSSELVVSAISKTLIEDDSEAIRKVAAESLGQKGSKSAIDALIRTFENDNSESMRYRTAEALALLGCDRGFDILQDVMQNHERDGPRGYAANAIAKLKSDQAIPSLLNTLRSDPDNVYSHHCAASALAEIGSEAAITALREALHDYRYYVCYNAAIALMDLGYKDGLDILYEILYSTSEYKCGDAAEVLGKWKIEEAVDALSAVVSHNMENLDSWIWSRDRVIRALARISTKESVDVLFSLLKCDNSKIRLETLREFNELNAEVKTEALLRVLEHEDEYIRQSAAHQLIGVNSESLILPLIKALIDEGYWVRNYAARALEGCSIELFEKQLSIALSDKDDFVRIKALNAIGYYSNNEKTLELLQSVAEKDPNFEVRSTAAEAQVRFKQKLNVLSTL